MARTVNHQINKQESSLVNGLMGLGKTYTAGYIAYWTGYPVTVFTVQWDTRFQIRDHAIRAGLDESEILLLPTLDKYCACFETIEQGGDKVPVHPELYQVLRRARGQGATASIIHKKVNNLVCQHDGKCEYTKACPENPEDYKLIIGHPSHAYVDSYVRDRYVLIDENAAQAFETEITATEREKAINQYLKNEDEIDADSLEKLLNIGAREQVNVLEFLDQASNGLFDPELGLSANGCRADAPALVYAALEHEDMDEGGFHRTSLDGEYEGTVILRDYADDGATIIRRPPNFYLAKCVIALDGTPHHEMWENRVGVSLTHIQVLDDEERREYIQDILGYNIYQLTDAMKPYSGGNWLNERSVFTSLEYVNKEHKKKPPFITSKKAKTAFKHREYADAYHRYVGDDMLHFNRIRSHSELEDQDLLVIAGSKHPGDRHIQRLAALDGYEVPDGEGKGSNKDYGEPGNTYYQHVCHNEVAQAIFRVGRAEGVNESHIYVLTAAIPEWIPRTRIKGVTRARSDFENLTIAALQELEWGTTSAIHQHVTGKDGPSIDTVRYHLENLASDGHVIKERDGRDLMWYDDGLDDVLWWGEFDPTPVDDE